MKHLERILASDNRLQSVPASFSDLALLQELDLRRNELKEVPASYAKLRRLQSFSLLGNDALRFPPLEAVADGTEAVMKLLCESKTCFLFIKFLFLLDQHNLLYSYIFSILDPSS
jgi:Leucine-rich repeat (LRR) protein